MQQTELAAELGVTPGAVSLWESGKRAPRDDQRIAIATALRTEVALLFPLEVAS